MKNKNKKEVWKDVIGFEGLYEVSNMGNVRSTRTLKEVGKHLNYNGYYKNKKDSPRRYRVDLVNGTRLANGRQKLYSRYVSTLVAEAFLGVKPKGFDVDHDNNNCEDDRLENLQYISHSDNCKKCEKTHGSQWTAKSYKKKQVEK